MDLQNDLSLKRLSLLSWSASFWNRQSINFEVQREVNDRTRPDVGNAIVLAKNELKAMDLPNVIYYELINTITWLGERVFKWYHRCQSIGVPLECTREIHWTVFGTIDEAKTTEKNLLCPDVALSSYLAMYGVYYKACICALKDYINRNATEIINFCRKHEREVDLFRHRDIPFLYRSVLTLANPESLNLSDKEKNDLTWAYFGDKLDCSKEAIMFEWSLAKGYTAAAGHYWQQLNPLEKENQLTNGVGKCFPNYTLDIDILVFLLSEMSENQRETFFGYIVGRCNTSKCFHILWAFMRSCAWEDHFFPVFYLLEDVKEHEEKYIYDVLYKIISTWKKRLTVGLDSKNPVYKRMFLAVWGKLKTFYSENDHYDLRFVHRIFYLFDMDVFNIVLEKYSFRQEFLELGGTWYKNILMNYQFGRWKEFMGTVLISPGERAWFKSELMSNLDDAIRERKFYLTDDLSKLLSSSNESLEDFITY